MIIKYINAAAGQGKTTKVIIPHIKKLHKLGEKVILSEASTKVCDQVAEKLFEETGIQATVIHSKSLATKDQTVTQALSKAINEDNAQVIIVTHQGLIRFLDNRSFEYVTKHKLANYHLIQDELYDTLHLGNISLNDTHETIRNQYEYGPQISKNNKFREVLFIKPTALITTKTGREDATTNCLSAFETGIKSVHYEVFAKFTKRRLYYSTFQTPSFYESFKSTLIASANFTNSTLYKAYSIRGVKFHQVKMKGLKELSDAKVTIEYCSEKGVNSRYSRDKKKSLNFFLPWAKKKTNGSNKVMIQMNKADEAEHGNHGFTKIPMNCHGDNDYSDHEYFISAASYNPNPVFSEIIQHYGMSIEEYTNFVSQQKIYQASMRGTAREGNPMTIIVMTKQDALNIGSSFPNGNINHVNKSYDGEETNLVYRPNQAKFTNHKTFVDKKNTNPIEYTIRNGNKGRILTTESMKEILTNKAEWNQLFTDLGFTQIPRPPEIKKEISDDDALFLLTKKISAKLTGYQAVTITTAQPGTPGKRGYNNLLVLKFENGLSHDEMKEKLRKKLRRIRYQVISENLDTHTSHTVLIETDMCMSKSQYIDETRKLHELFKTEHKSLGLDWDVPDDPFIKISNKSAKIYDFIGCSYTAKYRAKALKIKDPQIRIHVLGNEFDYDLHEINNSPHSVSVFTILKEKVRNVTAEDIDEVFDLIYDLLNEMSERQQSTVVDLLEIKYNLLKP